MYARWQLVPISLLALACSGEQVRENPERGPIGKADTIGSCQDSCGGQSDNACWCDEECSSFGDCCDDKIALCDIVEPDAALPDADVPDADVPDAEVPDAEVLDAGIPDTGVSPNCDYFADPELGNLSNDGSEQSPWPSLESVLASGQDFAPGEVVCLRAGNHGALAVVSKNYSDDVVFVGMPGETAIVIDLRIEASSGIVFESIVFDASSRIDHNLDQKEQFIIRGDVDSHHLNFLNIEVKSADSIETWTKDDWYNKSKSGLDMRGTNILVRNSQILNTYHAISLRGDNSEVSNTLIDNFAGDGIRGLGNFSRYESNIVRDAYVNDYAIQHDDLFQAFKLGSDPKIEGVILRNNRFMQFLDPITAFVTSNDLVSDKLQGIIITDGYADGWIVENNLVTTDHFHGITLHGARHCRVQNNTVVQPPHAVDTNVPWVRLTVQSKTGQTNFDNTIRNNLAAMFTTWEYHSTSVVENNSDFDQADQGEYRRYFSDYDAQNYELSATSPSINAGTNVGLLTEDLAGNPRISDNMVDTGAFEFQN